MNDDTPFEQPKIVHTVSVVNITRWTRQPDGSMLVEWTSWARDVETYWQRARRLLRRER